MENSGPLAAVALVEDAARVAEVIELRANHVPERLAERSRSDPSMHAAAICWTLSRGSSSTLYWPKPVFEDGRTRIIEWSAVERFFRTRTIRQGERTDLKAEKESASDGADPEAGSGE